MGKGRPPLCKICGKKLDADAAYVVYASGNGRKAFYCSQEEYESTIKKPQKKKAVTKQPKEKIPTYRDKAYELICNIIGRPKIINTILWKEWKIWNEVAADEVIAQYLEENRDYLVGAIGRLDNVEFNRIRYLSAILKNSLGDFKSKEKEMEKPKTQVDDTFYAPIATNNNKRRSLADLEDEF